MSALMSLSLSLKRPIDTADQTTGSIKCGPLDFSGGWDPHPSHPPPNFLLLFLSSLSFSLSLSPSLSVSSASASASSAFPSFSSFHGCPRFQIYGLHIRPFSVRKKKKLTKRERNSILKKKKKKHLEEEETS